uniref:lipopolysaccharide biosynthesis protein n=1 Tax=uncultured Allobacillus sp. TaxID=1638025 RepID=UPI002592C63F|nr:oligosaccharide flippase family protein [uncultured Allobacillus sp.]
MKRKVTKLSNSPFIKNVIILSTGTVAAQAISILLIPIITRLYGPEAYGMMGVFVAITGIVSPIAALTYPFAIVLPKDDKDAQGLLRLSLYISLGIATLALFILFFSKKHIVSLFNIEEVAPYLYLIPLVILFAGLYQVTEQWLIRTKQFGITAKVTFAQSLLMNGGKAGIGYFYPAGTVLIIMTALGSGLRAFLMIFLLRNSRNKIPFRSHKGDSIKGLANKYKDFPIFRAPQVFINAISENLPVVLLSSFFGPASVGFYTLGRTVLTIPSTLIGKAIGDVFYPRISEAEHNGENLTKIIKKAIFALGAIGIVPFGIIIIWGPWLFNLVFGAEWEVAGEYARWISIWLFFKFTYQPCIKALPVLSAQDFHLKFTFLNLIIQSIVILLGYYIFSNELVVIALFGVSGAVLCIILIIITLNISKEFDENKRVS